MNEWLQILTMVWSAGLFAVGGTRGKYWRRFVLPAGLAGVASLYAPWWTCIGYCVTTMAVLHLGYGDRCSWLKRSLIFTGYGVTSLWFGLSWWVIVVPSVCMALFFLSNFKLTEKSFSWKLIECLWGFLIAAAFVAALQNQWRVL
jgi:hypothetical protein